MRPGPDGRFHLLRGADRAKDQSYVLYMLGQDVLRRLVLPVGDLTKAQVRAEAAALGLRTADKPESMEVCFITRGGREEFLAARGAMAPGDIVDRAGRHLGNHPGTAVFTVGQRRGLGVAAGERRYVIDVDALTGQVMVGGPEDLLRDGVALSGLGFVAGRPPPSEELSVQARAHGRPFPGHLAGDEVSSSSPSPGSPRARSSPSTGGTSWWAAGSPTEVPGYLGAIRRAPSRRMVSPLM